MNAHGTKGNQDDRPARRNITVARVIRSLHSPELRALVTVCGLAVTAFGQPPQSSLSPTNIFAPVSTPAQSILDLSRFVLVVTAAVFVVVFSLLAYAVVKFRKKRVSDGREPAQVYGSTQVGRARTAFCLLIVVVMLLAASGR